MNCILKIMRRSRNWQYGGGVMSGSSKRPLAGAPVATRVQPLN